MKTIAGTLHSISRETLRHLREVEVSQVASSLAYITILSIIPLLAVSFAIFHAFGGLEKLYDIIEPFVLSHLAQGASQEAMKTLKQSIGRIHAGALGVSGLIGLIVTSMSMLSSAEKAINKIWGSKVLRPFFYRISSYWLFISLGPLGLAITLGATTSHTLKFTRIMPAGSGGLIWFFIIFLVIYRFVPNTKVNWIPALIASLFTSVAWNIARLGYAIYTKNVLTYDKIYGSLGAVPIIILWIYITWLIVLGGAALSATLQKRLHPNECKK